MPCTAVILFEILPYGQDDIFARNEHRRASLSAIIYTTFTAKLADNKTQFCHFSGKTLNNTSEQSEESHTPPLFSRSFTAFRMTYSRVNEHRRNERNAVFARYRKIIVARQRQGLRSYEERSLLDVNEHHRNEHNAVFARYNGFLTVCLLHPLLSVHRTGI